jgi:hypothetical protein
MGIEDVVHAHGCELTGFLSEERVEQGESLIACLGPAIDDRIRIGELALLPLERTSGALDEPALVELGEIAEPDGIAGAWRALMRELGEGIGNAINMRRAARSGSLPRRRSRAPPHPEERRYPRQ